MKTQGMTASKPWTTAVLYGIGGNLLLFFFLNTFLPLSEAARFLPWTMVFTGAASGYTYLDRVRVAGPHRYGRSAACGAAVGGLTWLIINTSARFIVGMGTLPLVDLLLFLVVCTACGVMGAGLAVKSRALRAASETV